MGPLEFLKSVLRTWRRDQVFPAPDAPLLNALIGMIAEAAEVLDIYKKHWFHGVPLDMEKVKAELGDVLYYFTATLECLGLNYADIAEGNSEKLRKRYPDGFKVGGGIR